MKTTDTSKSKVMRTGGTISKLLLALSFSLISFFSANISHGQVIRSLKMGGGNYTFTVPATTEPFHDGTVHEFYDYGYATVPNGNSFAVTWTIPGSPAGTDAPNTGFGGWGNRVHWWGNPPFPAPVSAVFSPVTHGYATNIWQYRRNLRHSSTYYTAWWPCDDTNNYYYAPVNYRMVTYNDITFTPPAVMCAGGAAINLEDYTNYASGLVRVSDGVGGWNTAGYIRFRIGGVLQPAGPGNAVFTPTAGGTYAVQAEFTFNNGTTTIPMNIIVIGAPTINTQPVDLALCNGGSGGYSVAVTANPTGTTISYNWDISTNGGVGWTPLTEGSGPFGVHSGTTSPTLNLSGVSTSKNGNLYRARITAQGSCAVSTTTSALLTVHGQVPITAHPADRVICPGSNTTFVVTATAQSGALSHQWQVSTNGGSTWSNVANGGVYTGATTGTLTLTNPTAGYNNYKYKCIVQDGCGSINQNTSNAGTLTIQVTTAVTSNPVNRTVCTGTNTTFVVAANGTSLGYQWQESSNGGSTWANLANIGIYSGVTTNTLTLTNVSTAVSGYLYRVNITGACGSLSSTSATLVTTGAPVVTTDPNGGVVCQGAAFAFTSASTGSGLSHQWEFSTSGAVGTYNNIVGATSANYNIAATTLGNAGYYRVKVTNTCGAVTSGFAILTVNPNSAVATQPTNKSTCPSGSVSFTMTAAGTGTINYQWQVSTNGGSTYSNLTNTGVFSGVFTNTLTLNGVPPSYDTYRFRVIVGSSCGASVTSNAGILTINPIPLAPIAAGVARCGPGSIAATASSPASTPTFQWYTNAADIVPVYTGASYTVANLIATTNYYVSVTSGGCESPKTEVTYTLNPLTPVDIGPNTSICLAQGPYDLNADIADPAAAGNNFSWTANATNYSSTSFNPSVGVGVYVVSYTPNAGTTGTPKCYTPNTRTITVISNSGDGGITFDPMIVSGGNNLNLCVGDSPVTLDAIPSAAGGFWSTVSGNGLSFNGTTAIFTPNSSSFTDVNPNVLRYTVISGGCTASVDLNVYVKDNQNKPIVTGLPPIVCPGTTINLSASVSAPGTFTYEWKKPGASVALATTSTYAHSVTGTEVIETRSINTFGCRSIANLVEVNTPFASGNITASKALVNVTDAVKFMYDVTAAGNTYEWDFGDGYNSVEQNPTHYYFAPNVYTIKLTITSSLGCSQVVEYNSVTVQGKAVEIVTGVNGDRIKPNEEINVSSYPNPVKDDLEVESTHQISGYRIISGNGVQYKAETFEKPVKSFKVNVSEYPQGTYIIQFRLISGIKSVRIVKI